MKTLNDALQEARKISGQIEKLLQATKYYEYDDLSGLDFSLNDPDQIQLWEELRGIMEHLHSVKTDIDYMSKPVLAYGVLHENSNGRFEACGREFSSGSVLEALIDDGYYDCPRWAILVIAQRGQS